MTRNRVHLIEADIMRAFTEEEDIMATGGMVCTQAGNSPRLTSN